MRQQLVLLSLAGCEKQWFAVFESDRDLTGWYFYGGSGFVNTVDAEGLKMHYCWAKAPFEFRGDFSVTFDFKMDCDAGRNITHLRFNVSDGNDVRSNVIEMMLGDMGNIGHEDFKILMIGSLSEAVVLSATDAVLPYPIDRTGDNTVEIVKTGDIFSMYINDYFLTDFNVGDYTMPYASGYFIPCVWAYCNPGATFHLRSVKVVYNGSRSVHTY